jgi:hypothetical protein
MKLTARGALRTRQDSRRLSGFGSMWKSGESVQVFYPIVWDEENQQFDLLVAMCWGHNANPKEIGLKRIFIPTLSEIIDGEPKNPDVTFQFSRIAPLFIQGAKDKKLKELQEKNMQESARKTAMKKVEDEFEDKDAVIGKLRLVISTECVVVPLLPDGTPDSEKARLVSQDLSDSKINALLSILGDHKYKPDNNEATYLEVSYAFGTTGDRKQDGKVAPQGITPEYRVVTRYVDHWSRIEQQINGLPDNDVTIFKRNSSFRQVEEREIISAISTYAAIESDALDAVDDEGIERLKRNASIILDLKIPVAHEGVLEAVTEVAEQRAKAEEAGATKEDAAAPTLTNLLSEHKKEVDEARAAEEENADTSLLDKEENAGLTADESGGGLGNLAAMGQ